MPVAIVKLKSEGPYSQSKPIGVPKEDKEAAEAYDERTWMEHLHYDENDEVFIPPMAFKKVLDAAAARTGMKRKNKGQATFTKLFVSGVMVVDPVMLGIRKDEFECDMIYADSQGSKGSTSKRVWRRYPTTKAWEATVTFHVLDAEITEAIFKEHLETAGLFVGVGRFRPENGGYYGRFSIVEMEWVK